MAEIVPIDYPTIAVALLVEQYKNSTELQSLLKAMAAASLPLQTSILEIRDRFVLSTASGAELTIIGTVWDEARDNDTDDDYRYRINVKISLSISGTLPEIKRVLFVLYEATYVTFVPGYPAGFNIETDATISQENLERLTPAGVFGLKWPDVDEGNYIVDANYDFIVGENNYPLIDSDA